MNRETNMERRGLEGRGNANVIPQSALASHNPPCPGLSKGPQSCCPVKPQWLSAGQTNYQVFSALPQSSAGPSASEPGHPLPSSVFLHLLLSVSFPVSLPCLCLGLCSLQPPLLPLGPASHCAAGPSPLPHAQCQLYVKHETPH